jgi:glycosyltransferase involved in cell wall biosynthesis
MPVKNGAQFLPVSRRQLSPMLRACDELIIVNDHSTDESESLIQNWVSEDSRNIRLINNPGNGLVDALNVGITEANHEWIARFDVDDEYHPSRIEIQRKTLKDNLVAVFSDYEFISATNESLGVVYSAIFDPVVSISLISGQRTAHSSVIFNRDAVLSVGGYRKEDFPAEDLSLWLRLSRIGILQSIPEVLLRYRITPTSITSTNRIAMLSKKNDLLRNVGINPIDIKLFRESGLETFAGYTSHSNGLIRQALLIRDLRLAQVSFSARELGQIGSAMLAITVKHPFQIKTAVAQVSDRVLRNRYRNNIKPKNLLP